jgi:hypothetical protein
MKNTFSLSREREKMKRKILLLFIMLPVSSLYASPDPGIDWDRFYAQPLRLWNCNPFPELPYTATTVAQDELIARIRKRGLYDEKHLALAEELLTTLDPENAPAALWRWAVLTRMRCLLSVDRKAGIALAREWLSKNREHPIALRLHAALVIYMIQRWRVRPEPDEKQPSSMTEIREMAESLFTHYDTRKRDVIHTRHLYGMWLCGRGAENTYWKIEGLRQELAVREALLGIIHDPESLEKQRVSAQHYLENRVMKQLEKEMPENALKLVVSD